MFDPDKPTRLEPGKRIGFVDYKLDNFHANVFLTAIREKHSRGLPAEDAQIVVSYQAKIGAILDEPSEGLDPVSIEEVLQTLRAAAADPPRGSWIVGTDPAAAWAPSATQSG